LEVPWSCSEVDWSCSEVPMNLAIPIMVRDFFAGIFSPGPYSPCLRKNHTVRFSIIEMIIRKTIEYLKNTGAADKKKHPRDWSSRPAC
jgi:hypothetical protein